jgi:dTDP-4-dehydrorhamnose 3,5-epimerase
MNIIPGQLAGLLIVEPKVFGDPRGYFMETWNARRYREAGLAVDFVQDNISVSARGILRGLHFQNPASQGKLVSVLDGEVFDVAVDLRRSSSTFGKWSAIRLSSDNKQQFYIPPGFAHGFQVLSERAMFHYKCTDYYAPQHEWTLAWDDPDLAVDWPLKYPAVSAKDSKGIRLRDCPPERLF